MLAYQYDLSDEKYLIQAARSGDENAKDKLIRYYEPEIKRIAFKYYLQRSDYEDLLQEGRIAVYKALFSYDLNSNTPFVYFVRMVIKRKVIDALRTNTRLKHVSFNESLSLHNTLGCKTGDDKSDRVNFLSTFTDNCDLEEKIIADENIKFFISSLTQKLSPLEKTVFEYHFLKGYKPKEIVGLLNITSKSLDNTIQRIKKKSLKHYSKLMAS